MTAPDTPKSVASTAYEALTLARENAAEQEAHERLCAERYGTINTNIAEIKKILAWAGGSALTIIISLLAYLAVSQYEANHDAQAAANDKIDLLERQLQQYARPPGTPQG